MHKKSSNTSFNIRIAKETDFTPTEVFINHNWKMIRFSTRIVIKLILKCLCTDRGL